MIIQSGIVRLAEAFKVNSTLTVSHLDHNGIGDQGATALAEALKENSTLTVLHLDGNDIGVQGATGLAEALKVNSTLTVFHLGDNRIRLQNSRFRSFRKARSAVSVILECEAREPHTPTGRVRRENDCRLFIQRIRSKRGSYNVSEVTEIA